VPTVTAAPVESVITLTNEYAAIPRAAAGRPEPLPEPAGLGLPRLRTAELARTADALYPVFAASSQSAAVSALNAILLAELSVPQLDPDEPTAEQRWYVPAADRQLLVSCAAALLRAAHAGHRFGLCGAARCADVFVDSGRGRPRRYCSTICQNRAKTANFRQRAQR
jgi:predicted RNA-binding Zn ribbon-like protein